MGWLAASSASHLKHAFELADDIQEDVAHVAGRIAEGTAAERHKHKHLRAHLDTGW